MHVLSISLFVGRGFGRNSSQTEVLQSPWIPETCSRHLLIFSSAKYNYTQSCLLAGTLVTAFFVKGLFLKKSHISPPLIWQRVPKVKFVFVCDCIFVFVSFLSFCVYFYLYFRRIWILSSVSGFTWPPSSGSPHQPALDRGLAVNLDRVRWQSTAPYL